MKNPLFRKIIGKLFKSQNSENISALKKLLAYVRPKWARLGLGVVLGMASAMFNALMLISFHLILSMVLERETRVEAIGSNKGLLTSSALCRRVHQMQFHTDEPAAASA